MFSGFNEILLIAAIVLALILIPRLNATRAAGRQGAQSAARAGQALSGRQRLAILASILWLAFWAVYDEPWHREWQHFAYFGVGPLLVAWGLWWVRGSRRRR